MKSSLKAIHLRTGNLKNPLGVGGRPPELSWQLAADEAGAEQSAWQVRASRNAAMSEAEPLLWDSGKVVTGAMTGHRYGGPPLRSRDRVYWQVRVWDRRDIVGDWSEVASFEAGLLEEADWDAQWTGFPPGWSGHAVYFLKHFDAPENARNARLYLSGPAWSEAWINGVRLGGNAVLQPAQSDFAKSCHYLTYDITPMLKAGQNVLAIHAGAGWYGTPVIRYRVEAGGELLTRSHFRSRPQAYPSPVCRHSVYGGEEYDARLEIDPSWKIPGGAPFPIQRAALRIPGPSGVPRPMEEEPIVPQEEIPVLRWERLANGHYSADFGRNFAGWCRLKVQAPAGTRIELIFSEFRYPDGSANQENLLGDKAIDAYTAAGREGGEVFEPHFTYHGFRYVEVRGLPGQPEKDTLTGIVLRTDCRPAGEFSCANELANRIFTMIRRTEESNLHAVPTDCPQRTERMGWLNDMMARCEGSLYLFDESNLLTKWLRDIAEAQDPVTGDVPMTAPFYWGFEIDPVCSSFLESAWLNYAFYGKYDLLEELYPNFRRWVECLLNNRDADGILRKGGRVGDWVPPLAFNNGVDSPRNHTVPSELVATALTCYSVTLLARIAGITGREEEKRELTALAETVRTDFNRVFRSAPGRLTPESQSAYAYAVYCGLFPVEEQPRAAARLAELFRANNCKHTTGNIGTKYLLETLARFGYEELAWQLITSTDYPGWGYMLVNGATTLWERWELAEGCGMNSHNHPMLGCPCGWFFRYPAGIRILPDTAGFGKFELNPLFIKGLDHAGADYESRAGMVRSHWKRVADGVEYEFEIPPGCQAEVKMPSGGTQLFHSGRHTLHFR